MIAGGAFFVQSAVLPLSVAWDAFREKNGSPDFLSLRSKILSYSSNANKLALDPMIGCKVLSSPFFFPEDQWIPQPTNWSPNLVAGRAYDEDSAEARQLLAQVQAYLTEDIDNVRYEISEAVDPKSVKRYAPVTTMRRLGQGAFEVLITEAYQHRCAATQEQTVPVLQAAHIKPYSAGGFHEVQNGILLRSDIHTLFDLGYITIASDLTLEVSSRIKEEYKNGREYYALHGRRLHTPASISKQPHRGSY
ncbi:MAG: HNH endonuclease [Chloroflexi bacterium]|nr:HNH endonuclease [Chloroflexota bacterium]